jgi:hypothetical protein
MAKQKMFATKTLLVSLSQAHDQRKLYNYYILSSIALSVVYEYKKKIFTKKFLHMFCINFWSIRIWESATVFKALSNPFQQV